MSHRTPQDRGFTTIELLVVIGIIVLLISLLIPVVGKVRDSARATDTAAWVQQLGGAIEAYHADFRAYPGPLADSQILNTAPAVTFATGVSGFKDASGTAGPDHITMSENLLLGLLGGLKLNPATPDGLPVIYDPSLVGNGASSLNRGAPKRFSPYVEFQNTSFQVVGGAKTGEYFDEASMGANSANPTGAEDSNIPEFVDRYSDPLPILYYRCKVGANATGATKLDNPVITYDPNTPARRIGPYDVSQNAAYTRAMPAIGVGRKQITYYADGNVQNAPQFLHGLTDVNLNHTIGPVGGPGYTYPYTGFPYFRDPSLSNPKVGGSAGAGHQPPHVPRQKDRFILIAAGPDRIYGTTDDITNFGPVVP